MGRPSTPPLALIMSFMISTPSFTCTPCTTEPGGDCAMLTPMAMGSCAPADATNHAATDAMIEKRFMPASSFACFLGPGRAKPNIDPCDMGKKAPENQWEKGSFSGTMVLQAVEASHPVIATRPVRGAALLPNSNAVLFISLNRCRGRKLSRADRSGDMS